MLSKVQLGPRYFTLYFPIWTHSFHSRLRWSLLLYSQVAFLALVSTSCSGSKIEQWSGAANLTCTIEESVPSSAKLCLKYVLFLLIRLDTLSSSALECGITRTSLATVESSGNLGSPVAKEDMPLRWAQTTSILRTFSLRINVIFSFLLHFGMSSLNFSWILFRRIGPSLPPSISNLSMKYSTSVTLASSLCSKSRNMDGFRSGSLRDMWLEVIYSWSIESPCSIEELSAMTWGNITLIQQFLKLLLSKETNCHVFIW